MAHLGSGTVTLQRTVAGNLYPGALKYTGPTAASSKALVLNSGGGRVWVTNPGTNLTLSGTISETAAGQPLFVTGNGDVANAPTLTLTGANTYTGPTDRRGGRGAERGLPAQRRGGRPGGGLDQRPGQPGPGHVRHTRATPVHRPDGDHEPGDHVRGRHHRVAGGDHGRGQPDRQRADHRRPGDQARPRHPDPRERDEQLHRRGVGPRRGAGDHPPDGRPGRLGRDRLAGRRVPHRVRVHGQLRQPDRQAGPRRRRDVRGIDPRGVQLLPRQPPRTGGRRPGGLHREYRLLPPPDRGRGGDRRPGRPAPGPGAGRPTSATTPPPRSTCRSPRAPR